MALKLKLDADGHVVVQEGKPVYTDDVDGKELAFDADQMRSKISELNTESKQHRLSAKEKAELLDKFGDAKPEEVAALRATLTELGGPEGLAKLREAGKTDVEAIKKSITDSYESKLLEAGKTIENLTARERQLLIGNGFASSKFLAEKTVLPPDVAEAYFGKHFRIEDGKVVAYKTGDEKIYSRERPGEPADVEEALMEIVNNYSMKDRILKGTGGGSGALPNGGGKGANGEKTISRAEFTALPPAKQSELAIARVTITD